MSDFWGAASQGFTRGVGMGVDAYRNKQEMDMRQAEHAARMEQVARERARETQVDNAFRGLQTLRNDGVISADMGLSQPTVQDTYAGNMGYGRGEGAVREMAGDFARESNRFGLPEQKYNPAGEIRKRAAKQSELYGGMQGVAAAQRDMGSYAKLNQMRNAALDDETVAEVKLPDPSTPEWQAFVDRRVRDLNVNDGILTIGSPDKDGFVQASVVKPDGRAAFMRLSQAEQLKLAQADALMARNPVKAMKMIEEVNKDLADSIKATNDQTSRAISETNDVAYRRGALANDNERTRMARLGLGLQRDAAQRANMQLDGAQYVLVPDDKGGLRQAIQGTRFNRATGQLEIVTVPLSTDGAVPMAALDATRLAKVAETMVGQPTGRMVNGKPEMHTMETAMDAARQQVIRGYMPGKAAGSGIDLDAVRRAKEADKARGGANGTPANAAGGLPVPVDTLKGQPIGVLTPRRQIEEAARAGNPRAIQYLKAQEENATAPRDTASMLLP